MNKAKKIWTAVSIIAIIGASFFFWPKSNSKTTLKEFRFVITAEPPSLDWSLATDNVSQDILVNIMEGLIQFDKDLNIKPALAETWEISPDGKKYTFYLRKNAVWTDGKPITATDFIYSWKRLLDPKTASDYAYFLFDIKNAKEFNSGKLTDFDQVGVHATDDHTFVVELWHPASYFINIPHFWVTFPMRKDVVEAHGDHWTEPNHIVTCGPFKLKEWKHDYKVTLEPNASYYDKIPQIDLVTAYVINEDSTALSLYETGKIELIRRIPPLLIAKYKSSSDYRSAPFLRGYYYGFNVTKKPFHEPKVRQAFAMSVDRKQIPEILQGNQIPSASWIPKGMMSHNDQIGLEFKPEKAKSLLAEAGYSTTHPLTDVRMVYDTRDDNKIIAEFLQSQWKQHLNVNVTIENQEWKVHIKQLETDSPQLWRLGWGADFPDPDNFMNLFTSYSGNNHTQWKSKEYDQLIEEAAKTLDFRTRTLLYDRAQRLLTEIDVPLIPLFNESQNQLVKPYVQGYDLNAMGQTILKSIQLNK